MRRSIIAALLVVLLSSTAFGGSLSAIPLAVEGVQTNQTIQTSSKGVYGKVYAVVIKTLTDNTAGVGTFTNAVTLTLTTTATGGVQVAETVLTKAVTTAATYYPRVQVHSTAGAGVTWYEPFPVVGGVLNLAVAGSALLEGTNTNSDIDLSAWVILERGDED